MWIVRVALDRPYTFVVLALLILILVRWLYLRPLSTSFPISISRSSPSVGRIPASTPRNSRAGSPVFTNVF